MAELDPSYLGREDYDPIEHLNLLYQHPASLKYVSKVAQELQTYQSGLAIQIEDHVRNQREKNEAGMARVASIQQEQADLFAMINDVQEKARDTEDTITAMTAEIKRLDTTKKNLTLSMTALKRLQMLTTAYEQLQGLISTKQYRECAQLLQAVMQLMSFFKTYRAIDQIATLGRNVSDTQRELLEKVCEDFEVTFAKGEIPQKKTLLAEGCLVMDTLGDNARSRLITWYCNTQLRDYRQIFRAGEEAGSLDNISRRFSWFKRMLKTYDDMHAILFPPQWKVDEALANAFCESTKDDVRTVLMKAARRTEDATLDVNLLLGSLEETLEFEQMLERKFSNQSRLSMDTILSNDDKTPAFAHAISGAFHPYLSIWVQAQESHLNLMIAKYRIQPAKNPDDEFNSQLVIASSTELFGFYRRIFAQCAKLTTGSSLLELSKLFAKYLDIYAQQVLLQFISERPSGQTPSRIPTLEDAILVLNTADYCYNTSKQLEEKIQARLDEPLRADLDMSIQADAFMGIASAAVRILVRRVETAIEHGWREMRNTSWGRLQNVVERSTYVGEICKHLQVKAQEILSLIHKAQYARAFCDHVAESVALTFMTNILQYKPISEVGAEQMLMDSNAITQTLEELPKPITPDRPVPALYIKRVQQLMSRILPLLKTLQVRGSPPESLVQAYLLHIADKSETNFRKILEMKGMRRQDQNSLVELFNVHKTAERHADLPASSPMWTPLLSQTATTNQGISTLSSAAASLTAPALQNLPNMPARFDPSSLGSALLTAARDGVDRLGSASPSALSTAASIITSPTPTGHSRSSSEVPSGVVNNNLRNLGKFFKRDLSMLNRASTPKPSDT